MLGLPTDKKVSTPVVKRTAKMAGPGRTKPVQNYEVG